MVKGQEESFRAVDMLIILIVVVVAWVYTYVKTYQTVHFKYMQFIACQSHRRRAVQKTEAETQGRLISECLKLIRPSFDLLPGIKCKARAKVLQVCRQTPLECHRKAPTSKCPLDYANKFFPIQPFGSLTKGRIYF